MKLLEPIKIKTVILGTLAMTVIGFQAVTAQETDPLVITPEFINQLAEEALTNNPSLRATEKLIEAAQENERSIRRWDDPVIRFGRVIAEKEMRRDDGDIVYEVEQKLPLFGKPEAARRVAETETVIEQASADLKFQLLRKEIAVTVFETALAEETFRLAQRDLATLETLAAIAGQRYEVRTGSQLDLLRLQNERAKRLQALRMDGVALTNSRVKLNRLVGRSLSAAVPGLGLPSIGPKIDHTDELIAIALRAEPELKKMRREIERADAQAEQTRRQRYPGITVGVEARQYSGSGEFREGMAYVALNVPWGNRHRYDADYKRERARQEALELEVSYYELEVRNEVLQLTQRIEAIRQEALLYRDEIIPRTQLSLESARAAWESNAGSLTDLLESRRLLLDAEVMHVRAVTQQYQLLSELVLCCGLGDLGALDLIAQQTSSKSQFPNLKE